MIRVANLTKRYGEFAAVQGIDFEVNQGEVFGLLGPNGAGKTTTVEILEGLRPRTSGEVSVLGFDPGVHHRSLKDRIGVCLQAANFPEKIRVWEAVRLFAAFYSRTADGDALLRRLQLWDKRQSFYGHLSGGQKQRLALTLALLNDPQLLFLDEPSAGLDPQARLEIHDLVLGLRAERRTILLTTHYIEEAERLCDWVAIIDEGRIVALGTPREIQDRVIGASLIQVIAASPFPEPPPGGWRACDAFSITEDRCVLSVRSRDLPATLVDLVKWLDARGVALCDVRLQRPSSGKPSSNSRERGCATNAPRSCRADRDRPEACGPG